MNTDFLYAVKLQNVLSTLAMGRMCFPTVTHSYGGFLVMAAHNPSYVKLHQELNIKLGELVNMIRLSYSGEIQYEPHHVNGPTIPTWLVTQLLDAIWPEIVEELATIVEYEHALEHIAETHDGQCEECRSLAQSALDGVNREMSREIVTDA